MARIAERKRQLQLNLKEEVKYSLAAFAGYCLNTFISFREADEPEARRYEFRVVLFLWRMTIHPLYRGLFIIIIILYVFVLSSSVEGSYDGNDAETKEILDRSSAILLFSNFAFMFELIIKLIALDWKSFIATKLNIIDLALTVIFTIFFIIDQKEASQLSISHETLILTNKYAFLSAIRALRLIMVAQVSKSIRILLECIIYTFNGIGNFLALLFIFMYVYSLMGMQLFAGRLKFQ